MHLPFHIIQMLKDKSANDLRQPSDCEYLSYDIESKIGVHIGATTLKRLLGFAQDERTPHVTTRFVIAPPHLKDCLRACISLTVVR